MNQQIDSACNGSRERHSPVTEAPSYRTALLICCLSAIHGCGAGNQSPSPGTGSPTSAARPVPLPGTDQRVPFVEPPPAGIQSNDWFEDVTDRTGVRFTYQNGRESGRLYMIESFGGGVAAIDFDRDGDIDLFITGGGTISAQVAGKVSGLRSALYRNAGDLQFVDATVSGRLDNPSDYSQGCAVIDFDVDGFPDVFVCCYGRSRLYQNLGDGTYLEIEDYYTSPTKNWHTAASFADFDQDGLPDLFVARYAEWSPDRDVKCSTKGLRDLCGPSSYAGTICQVLHNSADGTFEDWSQRFGLQGNVHGLAVVAADLNLDGHVDFYVASDVTPNQLYLGGGTLPLSERGAPAGVAFNEWGQSEGSMGVDVADYDGDGRPDLFVTNFELEDNALYHNEGNGLFLYASAAAGLAGVSRMRVGFGTSLADFDSDGRPDLFVLNGNPIYAAAETPYKQRPQLFRNVGGRFEDISDQGGTFFRESHSGRGNATADLDDDGALDLITVQMNDPVRVLRNRQAPPNYVRVHLRAVRGEPDATGAWVSTTYDGRQLVQYATRGTGFFSQSDPRMIFPAEAGKLTADVTVHWPGRGQEAFRNLEVRQSHLLVEGRGDGQHE